jgi:hypothetical protein
MTAAEMTMGECYCVGCGRLGDFDPRNPVCDGCRPIRDHVVSMRTDPENGDWLAVCPCGWRDRRPRTPEGLKARDAAVQDHWRAVVATAKAPA